MTRLPDILLATAIAIGLALALDYWIFYDPGPIEPDFQTWTCTPPSRLFLSPPNPPEPHHDHHL